MPRIVVDEHPLARHPARFPPYRKAASMVVRRLQWMARPVAWQSKRRLRRLRDSQADRRAVICCNGPSLNQVDFEALRRSGAYCIGLNKINLLFDRTEWRPDCIVAVNPLVIEQNRDFYQQTDIPLYLTCEAAGRVRSRPGVQFLHYTHLPYFARDVSVSIYDGATVTYVALQVAFHLGCREVALVGCDHSFASTGPSNMAVKAEGEDRSHFDPRYFADGQTWQLPDLPRSEYAYALARDTYAAFGGEVVNCTEGGQLDIFRRQPLADFLAEPAPET